MKKFIYSNKNTNESIEIISDDILNADKLYENKTGLKPAKCGFISCEIQKIINYE